jgi:hypothetical protein
MNWVELEYSANFDKIMIFWIGARKYVPYGQVSILFGSMANTTVQITTDKHDFKKALICSFYSIYILSKQV